MIRRTSFVSIYFSSSVGFDILLRSSLSQAVKNFLVKLSCSGSPAWLILPLVPDNLGNVPIKLASTAMSRSDLCD